MTKQIHLNGFIQNSPSPHSMGLWKHELDQGANHNSLSYWTETAQILERGKFDALFIADVLGTYSVYGNSHDAAARHAVQLPAHDPRSEERRVGKEGSAGGGRGGGGEES